MLSKENIDKLVFGAIYSVIEKPYNIGIKGRNWTFIVKKYDDDDRYFMIDTYWNAECDPNNRHFNIELTDDNISNFKLEMIFDDVREVSPDGFWEYAEDARFNLTVDSCGCSRHYALKNRRPSRNKKKGILQNEIKNLENSLQCKLDELAKIDSIGFYE